MKDIDYYYNILNLDEKATYEMIKKSFRKLSLKYHPDCNKSSDTTEKYKEIVEAYENLCKIYEQNKNKNNNKNQNNQNQNNNQNQTNNNNNQNQTYSTDINNIIKMFSTYSKHKIHTDINILNKPIPIIHNIDITLFQSYIGCLLPVNIERWLIVDNNKIKEKETLYVNIPKGIDNNEIIIIKNKGNIITDSNIGDVKIIINIINETKFKREGLNLFYYHSISLKDALCGLSFKLESISGDKLNFENSKTNIITPNKTIKIKNKGMQRDNFCGDLIIQFNVVFPDKLTIDNINLLENIL
jgi:DnaJ-class molecular chaperone